MLEVRSLSAPPRFRDVSFTVRGRRDRRAGGPRRRRPDVGRRSRWPARSAPHGDVPFGGAPVGFARPPTRIARGLAYLTEDRKGRGILPLMSAAANITLAYLRAYRAGGVLLGRARARGRDGARRATSTSARPRLAQPAGDALGRQPAEDAARAVSARSRGVVILDEPTRGVDVGARAEIYALMNRLTADGLAILMISSDLPELLGMSDRVVVMREGRVTGELVARGARRPKP